MVQTLTDAIQDTIPGVNISSWSCVWWPSQKGGILPEIVVYYT